MTYKLEDVFEMNAKYPETFWRPRDDLLEAVAPPMLVKLIFVTPHGHGERMWVEIIMRSGNSFRGKLRNIPVDETIGTYGDIVSFEHRNIADITIAEDVLKKANMAEL